MALPSDIQNKVSDWIGDYERYALQGINEAITENVVDELTPDLAGVYIKNLMSAGGVFLCLATPSTQIITGLAITSINGYIDHPSKSSIASYQSCVRTNLLAVMREFRKKFPGRNEALWNTLRETQGDNEATRFQCANLILNRFLEPRFIDPVIDIFESYCAVRGNQVVNFVRYKTNDQYRRIKRAKRRMRRGRVQERREMYGPGSRHLPPGQINPNF